MSVPANTVDNFRWITPRYDCLGVRSAAVERE